MTTPLIVTAWLASLALVGWGAYLLGVEQGLARAAQKIRGVCVSGMATWPTSRGARAIVKALGGSVPPLPRRKGAK